MWVILLLFWRRNYLYSTDVITSTVYWRPMATTWLYTTKLSLLKMSRCYLKLRFHHLQSICIQCGLQPGCLEMHCLKHLIILFDIKRFFVHFFTPFLWKSWIMNSYQLLGLKMVFFESCHETKALQPVHHVSWNSILCGTFVKSLWFWRRLLVRLLLYAVFW